MGNLNVNLCSNQIIYSSSDEEKGGPTKQDKIDKMMEKHIEGRHYWMQKVYNK